MAGAAGRPAIGYMLVFDWFHGRPAFAARERARGFGEAGRRLLEDP